MKIRILLVSLFIGTAVAFWLLGSRGGQKTVVQESTSTGSATGAPIPLPRDSPLPGKPEPDQPPLPPPLEEPRAGVQDLASRFLKKQAENREALMVPFGQLMGELGFDKVKQENALAVLKEHQALFDQQMANVLSSGGRPPSIAQLQELDRTRDKKLREALGDQDFEQYQKNLDTIPERMALSRLEDRLDSAGVPLTDQQASQLLTSMVQAAKADQGASPSAPLESSKVPGGIPASADSKIQLADPSKRFESVSKALTQSASNLSPEQQTLVGQFILDTKELRQRMSSGGSRFGR